MPHLHQIEVANQQNHEVNTSGLVATVQQILEDHGIRRSEISIALVDDPHIRELNRQYLQHDYATDVISFVLNEDETLGSLEGQLIVSTDTALRVGTELGSGMEAELLLYVIHGTLHLVGLDDHSAEDREEMRTAERRYLEQLGLEHRGFDGDTGSHVDSGEAS